MKRTVTIIIAVFGMGLALAMQANAVTYTFQENGSNLDLGPTSTFNESGFSLTAGGFLTSGGATDLYAKSLGAGEVGLGTNVDGDHEINTSNFVQLTLPTTPPTTFNVVVSASVQSGESALVYFTTTPGTLAGATLLGTITTEGGSVAIPAADQSGFVDITAGAGNILLASATVTPRVPDSGTTVALLGVALAGIEGLRRMIRARR
jgi:hypothetical protein